MDVTAKVDASRLEPFGRQDCLRLLGSRHLGPIAVVIADQPLMCPVNYALHQNTIVFRTDAGNKLRGAVGCRAAFEIDDAGGSERDAWSVLVVGTRGARRVTDEARAPRAVGARAMGPGRREHWVSIRTDAVTGRRIAH
jgi:uncharacterized protein